MAEASASCRRELDLEIPADEVSKKVESVAKEFARIARVPGFRPGKAPVSLIRRRFADDIKGEVVQSLVPQRVEQAVTEQKLTPVSQPQVEKLDFVTSVGYLAGPGDRQRLGLRGKGPTLVITDLGLLKPRPGDMELELTHLHPGVDLEQARQATGVELIA